MILHVCFTINSYCEFSGVYCSHAKIYNKQKTFVLTPVCHTLVVFETPSHSFSEIQQEVQ